jgi:uncharacterized protein
VGQQDGSETPGPLAAVHAHVEAFNADDLESLVAGFSDDAVFASGEHLVVGRRGIRAMFADALRELDATLELRSAVVQGETAACELTERLGLEGRVFEFHIAAFYTVRGGVIARAKIYREGTSAP